MLLTVGRVSVIKKGRDFGKLVMVVSEPSGNFVEVEGPMVNKRKVNILHLWPLDHILSIKDSKELDKKVKI